MFLGNILLEIQPYIYTPRVRDTHLKAAMFLFWAEKKDGLKEE